MLFPHFITNMIFPVCLHPLWVQEILKFSKIEAGNKKLSQKLIFRLNFFYVYAVSGKTLLMMKDKERYRILK